MTQARSSRVGKNPVIARRRRRPCRDFSPRRRRRWRVRDFRASRPSSGRLSTAFQVFRIEQCVDARIRVAFRGPCRRAATISMAAARVLATTAAYSDRVGLVCSAPVRDAGVSAAGALGISSECNPVRSRSAILFAAQPPSVRDYSGRRRSCSDRDRPPSCNIDLLLLRDALPSAHAVRSHPFHHPAQTEKQRTCMTPPIAAPVCREFVSGCRQPARSAWKTGMPLVVR